MKSPGTEHEAPPHLCHGPICICTACHNHETHVTHALSTAYVQLYICPSLHWPALSTFLALAHNLFTSGLNPFPSVTQVFSQILIPLSGYDTAVSRSVAMSGCSTSNPSKTEQWDLSELLQPVAKRPKSQFQRRYDSTAHCGLPYEVSTLASRTKLGKKLVQQWFKANYADFYKQGIDCVENNLQDAESIRDLMKLHFLQTSFVAGSYIRELFLCCM
jgi:hypothetical protein